ncbi:hypothetical protein K474DRAFT_1669733 [Panus rudis PR-1116 ss-1]|nr:hypothetical protein K474DRAFT_1669733 [Panus rudis PR-1116 ss-1]
MNVIETTNSTANGFQPQNTRHAAEEHVKPTLRLDFASSGVEDSARIAFTPMIDAAHYHAASTSKDRPNDEMLELAMSISEEAARLTNAATPIPTDAPLPSNVVEPLSSWLRTRYDWEGDASLLYQEDVSADRLARTVVRKRQREYLRVPANTPVSEHCADGSPVTNVSLERRANFSSTKYKRRSNRKLDLHVSIPHDSPVKPVVVTASSSPASPSGYPRQVPLSAPITASTYLKGEVDLNIGMAPYESWRGKRGSLFAGLIALGALVGSPTTHPTRLHSMGLHARVPIADVRSPSPMHTALFSPWLDVLHLNGVEPVQSPWVADTIPESRFPHTP